MFTPTEQRQDTNFFTTNICPLRCIYSQLTTALSLSSQPSVFFSLQQPARMTRSDGVLDYGFFQRDLDQDYWKRVRYQLQLCYLQVQLSVQCFESLIFLSLHFHSLSFLFAAKGFLHFY